MRSISAKARLAALRAAEPQVVTAAVPISASASPTDALPADDSTAVAAMIAILNEPVAPGMAMAIAYDRKESALIALVDRLDTAQTVALHTRMEHQAPDDPLALAFRRIARERRQRVLAYVGARATTVRA